LTLLKQNLQTEQHPIGLTAGNRWDEAGVVGCEYHVQRTDSLTPSLTWTTLTTTALSPTDQLIDFHRHHRAACHRLLPARAELSGKDRGLRLSCQHANDPQAASKKLLHLTVGLAFPHPSVAEESATPGAAAGGRGGFFRRPMHWTRDAKNY
jgi:hypothetical protein